MHRTNAFTLVELMVVVTIIVILIAMLVPALDKARDAANKTLCISATRATAQNCVTYATSNKNAFPTYLGPTNNRETWAYDLRTDGDPREGGGIGILVTAKLLPTNGLAKVTHCPSMDNSGGPLAGHNMDVQSGYGYGSSWWTENPTYRIFTSYNYRAASYFKVGLGHLRSNKIGSGFVVLADTFDVRVRGEKGKYVHLDGYSRSFADSSAGFFRDPPDPRGDVEEAVLAGRAPNDADADGRNNPTINEAAFKLLARDR